MKNPSAMPRCFWGGLTLAFLFVFVFARAAFAEPIGRVAQLSSEQTGSPPDSHNAPSNTLEQTGSLEEKKAHERAKLLEETQAREKQKSQEQSEALENSTSGQQSKTRQQAKTLEETKQIPSNQTLIQETQIREREKNLGLGKSLEETSASHAEKTAESAQSLERLQSEQAERAQALANSLSHVAPTSNPTEAAPQAKITPQIAKPHIVAPSTVSHEPTLHEIIVEGNSVFTTVELQNVTDPFIGKEITVEMLAKLASAITDHYHANGFTLAHAYVPPQSVQSGVMKVFILEGRLGQIKIEGNRSYRDHFIKYFLSSAIKHGVIQPEKLQRALLMMNEFPNLHLESFLQPGTEPGTSDILILVTDKTPIHETIDFDNFGNALVGKSRLGIGVSQDDFTGRGDQLSVKMVAPFPSRENPFYEASYTLPIDPYGTRLGFSYSNADIKVGQDLQILDIRGTAAIWGLSLIRPIIRSQTQSSNLSLSLYIKDTSNFLLTNILNSQDRLREITADYNHRWPTSAGIHSVDVSATKGLGTWLGGIPKNYTFVSRAGADDTFTKINAAYSFIQRIFGDQILILRGAGQRAFSPLTPTEQYSIGGPDSVHGYLQSEFLGDSGWNLNAEYRFPLTQKESSDTAHLALFLDFGSVSVMNSPVGQTGQHHITGAGIGFRGFVNPVTVFRVELGYPIDPPFNQIKENPKLYTQFSTQL